MQTKIFSSREISPEVHARIQAVMNETPLSRKMTAAMENKDQELVIAYSIARMIDSLMELQGNSIIQAMGKGALIGLQAGLDNMTQFCPSYIEGERLEDTKLYFLIQEIQADDALLEKLVREATKSEDSRPDDNPLTH